MNIEKAKRQLRVMLSGPASGYMECATAVKAILDELEAAEKRNAEQQRSLDHRKFLLSSAYEAQCDFAGALGCAGDNESIMEAIGGLKQRIAELTASQGAAL